MKILEIKTILASLKLFKLNKITVKNKKLKVVAKKKMIAMRVKKILLKIIKEIKIWEKIM